MNTITNYNSGYHLQGDPITSVDLTLSSRDEDVVDDINRLKYVARCIQVVLLILVHSQKIYLLHAHGSLVYTLHVLQANLMMIGQKRE